MSLLSAFPASPTTARLNLQNASNIWSPDENFKVVKAIARTYKFSTRLQGTIQGWDEARRQVAERLPKANRASPHRSSRLGDTTASRLRSRRAATRPGDVEKGIAIADDGKPQRRATSAAAAVQELVGQIDEEDLDMYKLLQEQYNYTTIDHAPSCKSKSIAQVRRHLEARNI